MTQQQRVPVNVRAGLVALFVFAAFGLTLELLHGLKLGFYLDVSNETRRFLWRLAHAHGALLGLLNVCCALAVRAWPELDDALGARALLLALLLMPLGFLLGGLFASGGDPGASVGLAAAGGVALLVGLGRFGWRATLGRSD